MPLSLCSKIDSFLKASWFSVPALDLLMRVLNSVAEWIKLASSDELAAFFPGLIVVIILAGAVGVWGWFLWSQVKSLVFQVELCRLWAWSGEVGPLLTECFDPIPLSLYSPF